jgi:Zn-finger in ubiquitin-hydrolases and other protein
MAKRSREEYELRDEDNAAASSGGITVETLPSPGVKSEALLGEKAVKSEREGDDDAPIAFVGRARLGERIKCPYLDTINRPLLDFDFEKVCSVSLSNHNVYGCLVCGKFFQGRGQHTHAYTHSVQAGHHVFINLHNGKVYCLPGRGFCVLNPMTLLCVWC